MRIGCHLSISKGLDKAVDMTEKVGANTFQFFTRNPRGGAARTIPHDEIELWKELRKKADIYPIVAHLPYTVNSASPTKKSYEFAKMAIEEDLVRMNAIDAEYLVFHPGSYVKGGAKKGIERIIKALEISLLPFAGDSILCLETMSGKGTEIGSHLVELEEIIKGIGSPKNLGICLDSCHMFAAGYDFRQRSEVDRLVEDLDKTVGLDRVFVAHLNDSKREHNSNKDRHALIGEGFLGDEGIANFINHPQLRDLPFVLETPVDKYEGYADEIKRVQSLRDEQ